MTVEVITNHAEMPLGFLGIVVANKAWQSPLEEVGRSWAPMLSSPLMGED